MFWNNKKSSLDNATRVPVTSSSRSPLEPINGIQLPFPSHLPVDLPADETYASCFPLEASEIGIGSHRDNQIVLDHPAVSGYHARLVRHEQGYRIVTLDQTLLYVNVVPATDRFLQPGDEIGIGPYRLFYDGQQLTSQRAAIQIDASHLKETTKDQVVLLNDISLSLPACSFVALVGSSGTGKSTLLNALSGLRPVQSGQIFYDREEYAGRRSALKIGYVPQDDIVHKDLSVERALYYAARLRLPCSYHSTQLWERIDEVLTDVELQDQRHLRIQKLSGGQRKRVSMALELLDKPGAFFLDEPTSGLDPGLDYRMMHLLRRLANKGQTIILVTHATSNIMLCDYVCFLATGGRMVYFGPPQQALTYFGVHSFAEIYSLLEEDGSQPLQAELAEKRFRSSSFYQTYILQPLALHRKEAQLLEAQRGPMGTAKCTGWQQWKVLTLRYLELLKNDVGNMLLLFLQAPVIAILIALLIRCEVGSSTFAPQTIVQCPTTAAVLTTQGLPDLPVAASHIVSTNCARVEHFLLKHPPGQQYAAKRGGVRAALQDFIQAGSGKDAEKVLFILGFTAVLFGCVNAIREIVKERAIYRRERAVNLRILPYMFSKLVVLTTLCLIQSAVLVVLVNLVAPFQQGVFLPAPLEVYMTIVLTSLAGLTLGLAVSALAPTADRALSCLPILLIPQVIFSGSVFPFTDWYTQLFALCFAERWAVGALGSSLGLHSDKLGGDALFQHWSIYRGVLFSPFSHQSAVLNLLFMWGVLTGMILVFTIAIGLFLRLKDRSF
ncbi:ATP-binding cassette domain-containing protein [Tengunoibacter tsumagoiensis]|uniref:ABC transporter domain-containing protein n=1 Tax=Tengunoibacter tsumagoiensis TaxID=2014871 RepID=A0A401ZZE2_9CHLR|nr:ATP-binding cassette domain-containing protein [Tengunoibacter tsumagoiensis]GCE12203.1 hypothetical protein KTT_20620 [Tengunoibacter tsumagoiensis]